MRDQRVKARIREHHVEPAARGGVAFERRAQIGQHVIEPAITVYPLKRHRQQFNPVRQPEGSLPDDAGDTSATA